MKAVVIHGPEQVSIDEVAVREPEEGEVLIKVMAAGLCGTDYELYTNDMVYIKEGLSRLPLIPGHEWSGVVVKAGPGVSSFRPGDKVSGECTVSCQKCWYCQRGIPNQCRSRTETGIMNRDGGFAEFITFPVSHLHRFKTLSFEEAALIEPTGIALYALQRGRITPFDTVVVMGPGPVGLQAAQIAKKVFHARKVILAGTRPERLERAAGFGLDGLINIRQEDIAVKVRDYTDGRMADLVLEESGGATVFSDIKKIINPCGRIVLNGFFGSRPAPIDWDFITVNDISIIGALGSPNIWDNVIDLLESGMIETKSLISHVLKLDEFEKGLDIMVNRRDNACKVILKP